VETLDGYPKLKHLISQAECRNIPGLREELLEVLEKSPPRGKNILDVANELITAIDAGEGHEVLFITAGIALDPDAQNPAATPQ
jgi:hypothetical protein